MCFTSIVPCFIVKQWCNLTRSPVFWGKKRTFLWLSCSTISSFRSCLKFPHSIEIRWSSDSPFQFTGPANNKKYMETNGELSVGRHREAGLTLTQYSAWICGSHLVLLEAAASDWRTQRKSVGKAFKYLLTATKLPEMKQEPALNR